MQNLSGTPMLMTAAMRHAALPKFLLQCPCDADLDGIGHEVTGHVIYLVTAVILPVLVANGVQLSHALGRLRPLVQLPTLHGVLLPAVKPEAMHLQASMTCILAPLSAEPPSQEGDDRICRSSKISWGVCVCCPI